MVAAYAQSDMPFYSIGQSATTLTEAPEEITLRFTLGSKIDASTLGSISIVRSGGANDPLSNANDIAVMPGSILRDSAPNENHVIIRFAETLPDDTYQIIIGPGLKTETPAVAVTLTSFAFRLDRAAVVKAVVPQPTASTIDDDGYELTQARNEVVVYFNAEDPLQAESAVNPESYRLQQIDADTNVDIGAVIRPTNVVYDPEFARATLYFQNGELETEGLFRLEIGGGDRPVPVVYPAEQSGSDDN